MQTDASARPAEITAAFVWSFTQPMQPDSTKQSDWYQGGWEPEVKSLQKVSVSTSGCKWLTSCFPVYSLMTVIYSNIVYSISIHILSCPKLRRCSRSPKVGGFYSVLSHIQKCTSIFSTQTYVKRVDLCGPHCGTCHESDTLTSCPFIRDPQIIYLRGAEMSFWGNRRCGSSMGECARCHVDGYRENEAPALDLCIFLERTMTETGCLTNLEIRGTFSKICHQSTGLWVQICLLSIAFGFHMFFWGLAQPPSSRIATWGEVRIYFSGCCDCRLCSRCLQLAKAGACPGCGIRARPAIGVMAVKCGCKSWCTRVG